MSVDVGHVDSEHGADHLYRFARYDVKDHVIRQYFPLGIRIFGQRWLCTRRFAGVRNGVYSFLSRREGHSGKAAE